MGSASWGELEESLLRGELIPGSKAEQLAAAVGRGIGVGLHQTSSGPEKLLRIHKGLGYGHLGDDRPPHDSGSALGSGRHPSLATKHSILDPSHLCSLVCSLAPQSLLHFFPLTAVGPDTHCTSFIFPVHGFCSH